ncbi:MAG TPA: asparaginase domain-containing protein, partial [Micromonosporaceae bacterium]|nr:asparaginase domain-containing protein [Micromonosporaceae bacterium]
MSDVPERRATVALCSLGGTIAMTGAPGGTAAVPALAARDLADAVPELDRAGVDLALRDLRNLPGAGLSFADVLAAAGEIRAQVAAGARGAVVTQGTDTIEET